ncbi:Solute carrier family 52, riboflavin transporter, member 3-A [Trichoplax sp. H2]|nr:Solute carrier family 52, riboflavin transporter, member 3-A [Trichoplax sp. H2]RDD41220.1 Solute carrier family 52, riboflavin transporter, member 3-A [Trichoplax sp. H2]|eukprot:RDD36636.1 Solute carrier family 52, riboflavin transporter, member 3-A [Trichoplax sp. H2]
MVSVTLLEKNTSWTVCFLAVCFGIGSWVATNSIWVELPIMVNCLPESWNLASYITVIIQIANLAPLTYSLLKHWKPNVVKEVPAIYVVLVTGTASCLLLAFFWRSIAIVGGEPHSIGLLILGFTLAMTDCTSSVTYLPFMATFREVYMPAYLVGEGLSGLLPGLVALGQGARNGAGCFNQNISVATVATTMHPTTGPSITTAATQATPPQNLTLCEQTLRSVSFTPETFWFILFGLTIASALAFIAMNYLPLAKKHYVIPNTYEKTEDNKIDGSELACNNKSGCRDEAASDMEKKKDPLPFKVFMALLFMQAWVNGLSNGVIPSIQSYATLPYGGTAFHLTVTLYSIANPLTSFAYFWLPCYNRVVIAILTLLSTVCGIVIIVFAAMSPSPPLLGTSGGSALTVIINVGFGVLVTYVKVAIIYLLRLQGRRALFWCGVSQQVGSCIGALIMFPIVSIFRLFQSC